MTKSKAAPDYVTLWNLYWGEGLSRDQIAQQFGVSTNTVAMWMMQLKVPRRRIGARPKSAYAGRSKRDELVSHDNNG